MFDAYLVAKGFARGYVKKDRTTRPKEADNGFQRPLRKEKSSYSVTKRPRKILNVIFSNLYA